MARKNHTSMQWRGLKVFVALMAGVTLAVLVTQYNTLQQRVRRANGRTEDDELTANRVGAAPSRTAPPKPEPTVEPEWEESATAAESPSLQEQAATEGQFIPENGAHDCPSEFPIKGNSKSHIYHLPGGASYNATIPNICFVDEAAAEAAGYRATKR